MFEMPVQQCNIAVRYVTLWRLFFPVQPSLSLGSELFRTLLVKLLTTSDRVYNKTETLKVCILGIANRWPVYPFWFSENFRLYSDWKFRKKKRILHYLVFSLLTYKKQYRNKTTNKAGVCVCVCVCVWSTGPVSECPLESPPVEGVTSSRQTPPVAEDEAPFQNNWKFLK
jgi:hypothetical protein